MINLRLPLPVSDNANYSVVQPGYVVLKRLLAEYNAGKISQAEFAEHVATEIASMQPARVFLTPATKGFRKAVENVMRKQIHPPPELAGRLAVQVELNMPDATGRDVTNYLKSLLDALTLAKLWRDDEQIDWCLVRRGPLMRGRGQCTVQVVQTAVKPEQLGLPEVEAVSDMVQF